jgi:hypothetical protein
VIDELVGDHGVRAVLEGLQAACERRAGDQKLTSDVRLWHEQVELKIAGVLAGLGDPRSCD